MEKIQKFIYQQIEVRTVMLNDQPWWVAKDVCEVLGHSNSRMALERLDEDEKGVSSIYTLGGKQDVLVVNEPGLYSLILGSRKPEAKAFKRWITHEVIPSIRKNGMYAKDELLDNPDLMIQVLTELKAEREQKRLLIAQVEKDRSKVLFAEALEISNNTILIGELAKLLKQNGVEIGQNRLFELLREQGYLCKGGERRNQPTQMSMDLMLFEIKKRTISNPDGSTRTTTTTKVTGKGQSYFINKFLAEKAS